MKLTPKPFKEPIYVVRPILPDLNKVVAKLENIWESQWLTNNGPQHTELKGKIKEYLGVPHVELFSNGTLALEIAIKALGLQGEVITTPFTFPATTHSIQANGLTPVFCDIEPDTYNIDVTKIEALITEHTTAIMPVHVFGNPCDVEAIQAIADKHNLKVIYDAAHAFGVDLNGKSIASFGDVSMYSFHATKTFHTVEGGGLTFNDDELVKPLEYWKNFGLVDASTVIVPGTNAKMNEIQAAVGIVMFDYLDEQKAKRKVLTNTYRKHLSTLSGIKVLQDIEGVNHNYYSMPILIDAEQFGLTRDEVFEQLQKYNVFARRYFYPLTSQSEVYNHLPSAGNVPVATRVSDQVLCMPLYGTLEVEQVEKICQIMKALSDSAVV